MKIKCQDGPLDGQRVSEKLGDRWPYVLHHFYGEPDIIIGYYRLENKGFDQPSHFYQWEFVVEELHIPRLRAKKWGGSSVG
jgi:hypothetical protein